VAASAGKKSPVDRPPLRDVFDTPDLAAIDDAIANGTLQRLPGAPEPLALFPAARVDYSLYRLYHYTGTDPEHFQNFVIFTNYQFYVDAFARLGHEHMAMERLAMRASRPSAFCRCERSSGQQQGHSDRNPCCSCHAVPLARKGILMALF